MERTEEALREQVRETPLSERLKTCEKYIASMCAERRPPKMTIPLQHYDEDFYIYTTLADAQATIAALQARVRELEEITKVICGHCCEPMEIPSKAVLQSALTQRTAERDTARRRVDELEAREVDVVLLRDDLEQRTAELEAAKQNLERRTGECNEISKMYIEAQAELERVRGERDNAKKMEAAQKEVADNQTWHVQKLRALIAALPKVEVVTSDTVVNIVQQYNFHQWMLRALQHRQGME